MWLMWLVARAVVWPECLLGGGVGGVRVGWVGVVCVGRWSVLFVVVGCVGGWLVSWEMCGVWVMWGWCGVCGWVVGRCVA